MTMSDPVNVEAILQREELLCLAIEAIACNYAIFDSSRNLVDCSSSYVDLHRATFEKFPGPITYDTLMREAIAHGMPSLTHDEAAVELDKRIAAHASDNPGAFDRLYPNGKWMRATKRLLPSGYVAGVALDITELKRREAEIAASEARYRSLVDTAQVGIWHLDESGTTLFANERLRSLYGGTEPRGLSGATLGRDFAVVTAGPFGFPPGQEVEAVLLASDGAAMANVLVCASDWLPIMGEHGRGAVLTLLDITSLKAAQAQVEHLAWHDALTGLSNRAGFQTAMQQVALRSEPTTLLLLDLDSFKAINDRFGHGAGDKVLFEVARRISSVVRAGDTTYRLGGDEFAVVLQGAQARVRAEKLAQRLIGVIARPIWADDVQLSVSASIGFATQPIDAADPETLQRAADLALYAAKWAGRARAVPFTSSLRASAERRLVLAESAGNAIAEGKLRILWQPQYALPGRVLRGAEALVRWPSSPLSGRELLPAEFFGQLEETGLMPGLDAWVIDAALAQLQRWAGCPGSPQIISVNVSGATLRDASFPARVAAALLRHGIAAPALEIELPESLPASDLDVVTPILEQLREMDVRLTLDGFGGGMSSMSHLVRLPVQLVKLDRSIVASLHEPRQRAILKAVVAVAKSLEIPVMAGGVETDVQAFVLRREGVQLVQGYLYGRPQRADELVPLSKRQLGDIAAGC